jgi:hypothetical protein
LENVDLAPAVGLVWVVKGYILARDRMLVESWIFERAVARGGLYICEELYSYRRLPLNKILINAT